MKEIKAVYFAHNSPINKDNGVIETFTYHSEEGRTEWFRQGNMDYNGKYITAIEYEI